MPAGYGPSPGQSRRQPEGGRGIRDIASGGTGNCSTAACDDNHDDATEPQPAGRGTVTAAGSDGIPVQPMAPTRSHQLSLTLRLEVKLNTHSETVPVAAAAAAADDTESPAGGA